MQQVIYAPGACASGYEIEECQKVKEYFVTAVANRPHAAGDGGIKVSR